MASSRTALFVLSLLTILVLMGCARESDQAIGSPKAVIVITIDTLRADHLGVYGYARDTSPVLDDLASDGVAVRRVFTQSTTTGPAHAALFTGLEPPLAGVISNNEQFPSDSISIMDRLGDRGWDRAGFVSGYVVGRRFGLQNKFDHFDDDLTTAESNRPTQGERPARETLRAVADWLASRQSAKPLFLWVHLIDPHGPYHPPEASERFVNDSFYAEGPTFEASDDNFPFGKIPAYQVLPGRWNAGYYIARYDAEIRYVDDALGEFFQRLREVGLWDESLLIVTSDHGETLDEPHHKRLFSHGIVAYDETARVPLIIRETRGRNDLERLGALPGIVRLTDLAPTLLARLGAEPLPRSSGTNLLEGESADRAVTLGAFGSPAHSVIGTQHSVLIGSWRYIVNLPGDEQELFDRRVDPTETRNLAADYPELVEEGRAEIRRTLARKRDHLERITDDEEGIRTLRSLGYIQ